MKLSLAFSPSPNDTFIFDALVNHKLHKKSYEFLVSIADIEQLNWFALEGEMDIVKISYAVYPLISEQYQLLTSGSELGYGNGPLLVSKKKIYPDEVSFLKIAIPGKNTTANLLLHSAFPEVTNTYEYLFSDIMSVVLDNETDAGILINEAQFTYEQKGLQVVADLGAQWEKKTSLPVPLGGIAIRRSLPEAVKLDIVQLIRRSLEAANQFPEGALPYMKKQAKGLHESVIWKHLNQFINDFSLDLGDQGKIAINELLRVSGKLNQKTELKQPVFVG